jgi:hypothetical protein
MSKKSRKRNKKILAAIGLGLGAMALSNRKPKQSDVSQDSGRGSGLRDTVDTPKKTTTKKETTITTPKTIQDNKYKGPRNTKSIRVKENTNKVYTDATGGESTAKVGNEKSNFIGKDGNVRRGVDAIPMTPGPRGTARAASEMSRGMLPPQLRKPKASQTFGSGNDGLSYMAKGGRVKGCGKALRGFGNAMKKGRK